MKTKKEQTFVITGTLVARAVQVLALGYALWNLKTLDSTTLSIFLISVLMIEIGLLIKNKE